VELIEDPYLGYLMKLTEKEENISFKKPKNYSAKWKFFSNQVLLNISINNLPSPPTRWEKGKFFYRNNLVGRR